MKKTANMRVTTSIFTMLLITSLLVSLSSCKKDKNDENDPARIVFPIPGMGNSDDELQGDTYALPTNVEVVGEIKGSDMYFPLPFSEGKIMKIYKYGPQAFAADANNGLFKNNYTLDTLYFRGSGSFVSINICLENKNSTTKTIEFPAGLTFKNLQGSYQNGLLVKKTSITIPANEQIYVVLNAYCSNLSKHASDTEAIYEFGPVVDIPQLNLLFDKVKNKKINVEEYSFTGDVWEAMTQYINATSPVQDAVWEITDFDGKIQAETLAAIDTIPNSGK